MQHHPHLGVFFFRSGPAIGGAQEEQRKDVTEGEFLRARAGSPAGQRVTVAVAAATASHRTDTAGTYLCAPPWCIVSRRQQRRRQSKPPPPRRPLRANNRLFFFIFFQRKAKFFFFLSRVFPASARFPYYSFPRNSFLSSCKAPGIEKYIFFSFAFLFHFHNLLIVSVHRPGSGARMGQPPAHAERASSVLSPGTDRTLYPLSNLSKTDTNKAKSGRTSRGPHDPSSTFQKNKK